MVTPLQYA
jgi:hypothetical protein